MIQFTRSGVVVSLQPAAREDLRDHFGQLDYVRLRQLIEPRLLEHVLMRIDGARFEPKVHPGVGADSSLHDEPTILLLRFLANSRRFFELVEGITGCSKIGCFFGRVYRLVPGGGHHDDWHNDRIEDRMVAMTVNLSGRPYDGGALEIRDDLSGRTMKIHNPNRGDAVLFRLAPHLHHRVADVKGDNPKTAFAGWFRSSPDLYAELKERAQAAEPSR